VAHKLHLFSPQVDVLINGVVVFVNKRITKSYSTLVQLSVTLLRPSPSKSAEVPGSKG